MKEENCSSHHSILYPACWRFKWLKHSSEYIALAELDNLDTVLIQNAIRNFISIKSLLLVGTIRSSIKNEWPHRIWSNLINVKFQIMLFPTDKNWYFLYGSQQV